MTYTPELAAQIADIHSIPAATLKTWQHRGTIPAKYFDRETGEVIQKPLVGITDAEKYRILRVYEIDSLNFSEFKSVTLNRLSDLERGKGSLTKAEYIGLKRELADLHNLCRPLFSAVAHEPATKYLKKVLADPRLKHYTLHETKYVIEKATSEHGEIDVLELQQVVINIGLIFQRINL